MANLAYQALPKSGRETLSWVVYFISLKSTFRCYISKSWRYPGYKRAIGPNAKSMFGLTTNMAHRVWPHFDNTNRCNNWYKTEQPQLPLASLSLLVFLFLLAECPYVAMENQNSHLTCCCSHTFLLKRIVVCGILTMSTNNACKKGSTFHKKLWIC